MALSNTQYDTIIRKYNKQQIAGQHLLEKRLDEVYAKAPQLKKIDDEISSLSLSQAKKMLDGDAEALGVLKERIRDLSRQRGEIITAAGFPADYLERQYTCPDCKDTGYINGQKCHCFKQAAIDLVYMQSNLKAVLEKENFNFFSLDCYDKNFINEATGLSAYETAMEALAISLDFVKNFDTKYENLFFYGETGVGKTFLSNCIAKDLLDTGHSVIYFSAFDLFEVFQKNTFDKKREENTDYQNIFNCDLLIIDDLGTELNSSFTTSQLFLCLNERHMRQKSTIISTNLNLGELAERYSERIFSRISSQYSIVKLVGRDIRIQKRL